MNLHRPLPGSLAGQGRNPALFAMRAFSLAARASSASFSFNMVSTLLRIVREWVATRSARGTVRIPTPAAESYFRSVESRRHDPRRVAVACPAESLNVGEDGTDVSCALRSKAESGPVGAHPRRGTARTLAGSVRCDTITIHDRVKVRFVGHPCCQGPHQPLRGGLPAAQRATVAERIDDAGASRSSSSMRFNAAHLSEPPARAIEISPTRSTCGTRRSRAAISSYNSRIVCARLLSSVAVASVVIATAVPTG